jgi:hypothetical protein
MEEMIFVLARIRIPVPPIAFGIFLFGGIFAAIYKAVGEKMGKDYESSYQFILGAVVISAVAVAAIELWPVLTN